MSWIVSDYDFFSKFYIRNVTFEKKLFKTLKYVLIKKKKKKKKKTRFSPTLQ